MGERFLGRSLIVLKSRWAIAVVAFATGVTFTVPVQASFGFDALDVLLARRDSILSGGLPLLLSVVGIQLLRGAGRIPSTRELLGFVLILFVLIPVGGYGAWGHLLSVSMVDEPPFVLRLLDWIHDLMGLIAIAFFPAVVMGFASWLFYGVWRWGPIFLGGALLTAFSLLVATGIAGLLLRVPWIPAGVPGTLAYGTWVGTLAC